MGRKPDYVASRDEVLFIEDFVHEKDGSNKITSTIPVKRLRSIDHGPRMDTEELEEMGNNQVTTDVIDDNVDIGLEFHEYGSTRNLGMLLNKPEVVATPHGISVDQDDLENAIVDMVVRGANNLNRDTVQFSHWLRYGRLNSLEWNFAVNGPATMSARLNAQGVLTFIGDKRDVYIFQGTTDAGSMTLADNEFRLNYQIADDVGSIPYTVLYVLYNNELIPASAVTLEADDGSDLYPYTKVIVTDTYLRNGKFESDDRLRLVVYKTTPGTLPLLTTAPSAIRRGQVEILLGPSSMTDTDPRMLRIQTARLSVNPDTEALYEIGARDPYYMGITRVRTAVTLEAFKTDLEKFNELLGGSQTELDPLQISNAKLIVKIYKENSKSTLLETFTFTGLNPTGMPMRSTIGGRATLGWELAGSLFTIVGAGVDPEA